MDFKERFKGRTNFMKKDGHIGIVINTQNPIAKDPSQVHHVESSPLPGLVRNGSDFSNISNPYGDPASKHLHAEDSITKAQSTSSLVPISQKKGSIQELQVTKINSIIPDTNYFLAKKRSLNAPHQAGIDQQQATSNSVENQSVQVRLQSVQSSQVFESNKMPSIYSRFRESINKKSRRKDRIVSQMNSGQTSPTSNVINTESRQQSNLINKNILNSFSNPTDLNSARKYKVKGRNNYSEFNPGSSAAQEDASTHSKYTNERNERTPNQIKVSKQQFLKKGDALEVGMKPQDINLKIPQQFFSPDKKQSNENKSEQPSQILLETPVDKKEYTHRKERAKLRQQLRQLIAPKENENAIQSLQTLPNKDNNHTNSTMFLQRKNLKGALGLNDFNSKNQFMLPKIHANKSFHQSFSEYKKQVILESISKQRVSIERPKPPQGQTAQLP